MELGLDLGCRRFGSTHEKDKVVLIMDTEPYRYQMFISDISGQDIYAHHDDERQAIDVVRDWLRLELDPRTTIIPSGAAIFRRYQDFQAALPALCTRFRWNPTQLPFADFSYAVASWIKANPI